MQVGIEEPQRSQGHVRVASFSPEKTLKSREKSFTLEVRKKPCRPPSLLAASNGLP